MEEVREGDGPAPVGDGDRAKRPEEALVVICVGCCPPLEGTALTTKNPTGKSKASARRSRVCGTGRASPRSNWLTAAGVTCAATATALRVIIRVSRASRRRRGENSALAVSAPAPVSNSLTHHHRQPGTCV